MVVRFSNNIVTANMDNGKEEQLSLDDVNLSNFVTSSEIVVGASHGHDGIGSRDQYQFGSGFNDQETTSGGLEIHTSGSYAEHFRGCIGEIRVGGILVPFYNDAELVSFPKMLYQPDRPRLRQRFLTRLYPLNRS